MHFTAFLWYISQTSRDRVNSRHVRTHKKNLGDAVSRLGTIIQSIFCAQSGASIRLTVWKWSGESRYPGAFPPVLENFRRAFSPGPTDCPWVSEDELCVSYLISPSSSMSWAFCCFAKTSWLKTTGFWKLKRCFLGPKRLKKYLFSVGNSSSFLKIAFLI